MKENEFYSEKEIKMLSQIYGKKTIKAIVKERRKRVKRLLNDKTMDPEEKLLRAIFDD